MKTLKSYNNDQIESIIAQSTDCQQPILLNCTANRVTGFRLFKNNEPKMNRLLPLNFSVGGQVVIRKTIRTGTE